MSETAIGEPLYKQNVNSFRKKINYGWRCFLNRPPHKKNKNITCLTKPKISFGFMCKNIIINRGYDQVDKSFASIYGQSNDIIVVDNDSEDAKELQNLCKKYKFRYFNVHSNPKYNWKFDISKVSNKIVLESKHDIFVRLTPDIIYPNNFAYYISSFFEVNDPKKNFIGFRFANVRSDGSVNKVWSLIWTGYRPYFIKTRGWDERMSYFLIEDIYAHAIMLYVYGCKRHIPKHLYLKHIQHKGGKRDPKKKRLEMLRKWDWARQMDLLKKNVNKYRKMVENSLW